jgi:GntR family transcriptional regulator
MAVRRTVSSAGSDFLWQQISRALADEIVGQAYPPGTKLDSEAVLSKRFGVSRVTMRQSLADLSARGLAHPRAGRGWFVGADDADDGTVYEPPGKLLSFTDMANSRGLVPDSIVISAEVVDAGLAEAAELNTAPGAPLFSLRRVRRLDGLAVAVDHSLIPRALLPDVETEDFSHSSLFESLRRRGIQPSHANYELRAIAADADMADLLEVEVGFPMLSTHQVMFDTTGRKVELGRIVYRGDRYLFRTVLQA